MERLDFYKLLDISHPEDFKYYENLESIMEADDYIEAALLTELFSELNWDDLHELFNKYFEELFRILPDDEDELCLTVENIDRKFQGFFGDDKNDRSIAGLTDEVLKFRRWFIHDQVVYDIDNESKLCVRDAVYNIHATNFGGALCNYDFANSDDYALTGYDVKISSLL